MQWRFNMARKPPDGCGSGAGRTLPCSRAQVEGRSNHHSRSKAAGNGHAAVGLAALIETFGKSSEDTAHNQKNNIPGLGHGNRECSFVLAISKHGQRRELACKKAQTKTLRGRPLNSVSLSNRALAIDSASLNSM